MSYNQAVATKRKERDIMKLLMSDYQVEPDKNSKDTFKIRFKGPNDSLYQDGIWNISVSLPEQYPYKSPSIGFLNRIWHPNIDEKSGSVCLDVINQTWSPMYELVNVFDVFLPQLLSYPNPQDPLNPDAAGMLLEDEDYYKETVLDYVMKYAQEDKKQSKVDKNVGLQKFEVLEINQSESINSQQIACPKLEMYQLNDQMSDENVSDISMSDVSELSKNDSLEMDTEMVAQY